MGPARAGLSIAGAGGAFRRVDRVGMGRRMPARASRSTPSSAPPHEGVAARAEALRLLGAALGGRGGLEEAGRSAELEGRDRGFARALTLATLRRLGGIDRLLDARLKREPPPVVRDLLRLGAAQLLTLDVPPFAAVSTTVMLAERHPGARPFKGLVNAVLRGLDRDGGSALLEALGPEADVPAWLAARWRGAYGAEALAALARRLAEEPATDLTPRDPADAPALAELLEAAVLPGGSLRTRLRGDPALWPGYAEGRWWVQDVAAALPARLLAVRRGETALDMCAAPGGKTLQLAAAGAQVTALDRSAARLARVSDNLRRTGLAAETVVADAGAWSDGRTFDAVLLDAPCSATGTFRRHPDVLWAARPTDIAKLSAVQARLLLAAAGRTAPGGRLVYAVCSLEPEEGEAQVAPFLAARPEFARLAGGDGEAGWPGLSGAEGAWRVLPGGEQLAGGADGFFVARFRRTS